MEFRDPSLTAIVIDRETRKSLSHLAITYNFKTFNSLIRFILKHRENIKSNG